jgi:lipoprotein
MKHYFLQITLILIAIFSLTIVSCSNDDDPTEGGDKIEINGVSYNLSMVGFMGSWNESTNKGTFTVAVDNESNGVINVEYYTFSYRNVTGPQVGDDFSTMNLALTPLNEEEDGSIIDLEDAFKYNSGKAIVTNVNPDESEITIRFEQLKMSHDGRDYTFNGNATLMFEY